MQVHQERLFQEYTLSRAEGQLKQMDKLLSQQAQSRELELNSMRGEISSLKRVQMIILYQLHCPFDSHTNTFLDTFCEHFSFHIFLILSSHTYIFHYAFT